jgi:enoyl-CoA hydratase
MFEITMASPAKNALGSEMMRFILAELRRAGGEPVLLTGSGDAFSAGLDLKEVLRLDEAGVASFLELLEECMTALYLYPGPTVALVNGHAIAGGAVLTLCCDLRVATSRTNVKIGLNEVALGLRFPPRILSVVRRRLPPAHIEEVLLGAGLFDPATALRLGLVDEIADDAASVARARLAALAAHPREAYALTKRDLRGDEAGLCPPDEHARRMAELTPRWSSTEVREKIAAIFKR